MASFYGMVDLNGSGGDGVTREEVEQMISGMGDNIKDDIKSELLNYQVDDDQSTSADDDVVLVFPSMNNG